MEPPAPPNALLEWLQCAFWLMGFVLAVVATVKLFRGKPPQPPNQQLEQAHGALKESFDQHVEWDREEHQVMSAECTAVEERLGERVDNFERASLESRRNMHRDLDAIAQSSAALREASTLTNQRLVQIETKLDRNIERQAEMLAAALKVRNGDAR